LIYFFVGQGFEAGGGGLLRELLVGEWVARGTEETLADSVSLKLQAQYLVFFT
jgi:hypothetical protein